VVKSNKTPEQIERSRTRNLVKSLNLERIRLSEKISELGPLMHPRSSHRFQLETQIEIVQSKSAEEFDRNFRENWNIYHCCIWFGVGIHSTPGAYGYSNSFWHSLRRECKEKRSMVDVYCSKHREMANHVLANETFPEKSERKPILPFNLEGLKTELIEAMHMQYLKKVEEAEQEIISSQHKLKSIEKRLAELRDVQAEQESSLKRKKLPENTRLSIYKNYDFKCAICRVDLTLVTPHIDHIVPLAKGGKDVLSNLQPLCGPCNLKKGAK
jgi:5-methylcytosine-specific restriction endonuclease McrA